MKCWSITAITLLLLMPIGCSSSSQPEIVVVKQDEIVNLGTLGVAYEDATRALGRPPQNETELRPYLKKYGDPDILLRSAHDGQPYVILYGRNIRKMDATQRPILVHEKQGVNGRRYVLNAMGIMPMTDEEFAKADVTTK